MGVLKFDGIDDELFWATITSAIGDLSTGAYTVAALTRRSAVGNYDSMTNLLASGVSKGGLSYGDANAVMNDHTGGPGQGTLIVNVATGVAIAVTGKASGTVTSRYSRFVKSSGIWSHEASPIASTNQVAANQLQIGRWQGADPFEGWIGLVGFWSGNMSDANRELLSTNWRTSDWWQNQHGTPVFLAECHVAAASVVDLAANASNYTGTGAVLDSGESLSSFNFDGKGNNIQPTQRMSLSMRATFR